MADRRRRRRAISRRRNRRRLTALRERVRALLAAAPRRPRRRRPRSASRLQALGYVGAGRSATATRADPKDRRELAGDIARVTSGELRGQELESALRRILAADPANPQANMRLGFVAVGVRALPGGSWHFAGGDRRRDAGRRPAPRDGAAARFSRGASTRRRATLRDAERAEPGNPVAAANLGIVLSDGGRPADARRAARARAGHRSGLPRGTLQPRGCVRARRRRAAAAREAEELLRRLPPDAPQRAEVQRLLDAVR